MMKLIMLTIGMTLIALPAISNASNKEKVDQPAEWSPPHVVHSISAIGRAIDVDGESLRCYTFQEGRQTLLPMFADYRALFKQAWIWEAKRAEYESNIALLEMKIKLHEITIEFYKDEADDWHKVALAKSKQFDLSKKWAWVPWGLLVVESLAVGIIGVKAMATN